MKKKFIPFIIILLLICLSPFLFIRNIETENVTHLKQIKYSNVLEVTGNIVSEESIPIKLSYPVYIKESLVSDNMEVNKGQLLFILDIDKMQEALNNSQYAEVMASFDKSQILSGSDKIYASESGIVRNLSAENGAIVMANENLCVIDTSDDMLLKISINQEDYSNIEVGDTIEFSPIIMPNKTYYGQICNKTAVVRKEPSLTGNKTVIDIYANIENADNYITDGIQISGKIINDESSYVYTLPYDFVNQDENGEYVTIFSDGEIIKKYISTGIETANEIQILTPFKKDTLFLKNNTNTDKKILLNYEFKK